MDGKNITIYDIAKEADVSPATVSRVITGNVGVSEEKAERVKKAIEKYQFVPNAMAKGLKEQRSKVIGVIVPDIKNPYFASLFYEIQIKAVKNDFMVFLCNTANDTQIELKMLRTLINKQVEALVIIGGALDYKVCDKAYIRELQEIAKKIPLVITTATPELECIKVTNNDLQCMALLTAHLAQKGYKKVALLGGNSKVIPSYDRRKYFLEYAQKNNLVTKKEWIIDGGFTIKSGIELMKKLWSVEDKPDAVCGINDLIALGILKFAHEQGLKVPSDIGIMGCDGIVQGETSYPALSTVATPYSQFGEAVIQSVLAAIQKQPYPKFVTIDMQLVNREST